jgi:hypothetical protein
MPPASPERRDEHVNHRDRESGAMGDRRDIPVPPVFIPQYIVKLQTIVSQFWKRASVCAVL